MPGLAGHVSARIHPGLAKRAVQDLPEVPVLPCICRSEAHYRFALVQLSQRRKRGRSFSRSSCRCDAPVPRTLGTVSGGSTLSNFSKYFLFKPIICESYSNIRFAIVFGVVAHRQVLFFVFVTGFLSSKRLAVHGRELVIRAELVAFEGLQKLKAHAIRCANASAAHANHHSGLSYRVLFDAAD